jgi:hypothetical protein
MKRLLLLLLVLLLSACAQREMVNDDLDYAYNLPPVGSTLVLKRPLTVPAGEVRIFLQRGELFSKADFDRYEPSCSLELRKLAEVARTIQPDRFIVTRVQRLMQQVVSAPLRNGGLMKAAFEDSGGKPMVVHGYHLWLGSDTQPDVMRMTCRGFFDDINRAEPPSLNDVMESLGDFADLELAI